MEIKTPLHVVYTMRNGELVVSDKVITGVSVRGIMLTKTIELLKDESLDNYEGASLRASKIGGKLLDTEDFKLVHVLLDKIERTKQILQETIGTSCHFYKVPTLGPEFYWTSVGNQDDLILFGKAHRHKCVCIETLVEQFKPDVFFMATLVKIKHPFPMY